MEDCYNTVGALIHLPVCKLYTRIYSTIDPSRYTARGMGADKLQEYIKLYLRLQ